MNRQNSFPPIFQSCVKLCYLYLRGFFQSCNDFSFVPAHLNFLLFFHESPVINLNLCGIDNPQLEFQHMQVGITSVLFSCQAQFSLTELLFTTTLMTGFYLFCFSHEEPFQINFFLGLFFFSILFYQFAFSLIPPSNIFYHSSLKHLRDFFFLRLHFHVGYFLFQNTS